jgi:hypothetical protein
MGKIYRLAYIFIRCIYQHDFKRATKIHKEIGKQLKTYEKSC